MKKILTSIFWLGTIFYLLFVPVFAQEVTLYTYCFSNTTLRIEKNVTITVAELNRTRTITATEDVLCNYGCSGNECLRAPWIMWGIILVLVIFFIIIWALFFRNR